MKEITDEKAERIGKAGRKRVLSEYTWGHTIDKILEVVNAE